MKSFDSEYIGPAILHAAAGAIMQAGTHAGRPAANSEYVQHVIGYAAKLSDAHYEREGRTFGQGTWNFAGVQASEQVAVPIVSTSLDNAYDAKKKPEPHFTFQQAYHLVKEAQYQDLVQAHALENASKLLYFQKESRERILKLLGQTKSQAEQQIYEVEAQDSDVVSVADETNFEIAEYSILPLHGQRHLPKYVYFLINGRSLADSFAKSRNDLLMDLVNGNASRCVYFHEELDKNTLEELLHFLAYESYHCYRDVYRLFVDAYGLDERFGNYERFVGQTQNSPLLNAITIITANQAAPLPIFYASWYLTIENTTEVINLYEWIDAQKKIAKAPLQLLLKTNGRKLEFSAALELTDFKKCKLHYTLDAFIADQVIVRRGGGFCTVSKPAQEYRTKSFCCTVEWLSFGLDEKP